MGSFSPISRSPPSRAAPSKFTFSSRQSTQFGKFSSPRRRNFTSLFATIIMYAFQTKFLRTCCPHFPVFPRVFCEYMRTRIYWGGQSPPTFQGTVPSLVLCSHLMFLLISCHSPADTATLIHVLHPSSAECSEVVCVHSKAGNSTQYITVIHLPFTSVYLAMTCERAMKPHKQLHLPK